MKQLLSLGLVVLTVSGIMSIMGRAQGPAAPSLGELARQLRAKREKAGQKAKVYTNDDLPTPKPDAGFRIGTSTPAVPAVKASAESTPGAGAKGVHDEKYFRTRMSELQARLEEHQRQLNVLQQKLGQGAMQFYSDPNKTLQQEYSRSDVTNLSQDIQNKKQELGNDQKAIEDLRDQLRREGGDPGWLR